MTNILLIDFEDILHFTTVSGDIDNVKVNPHIYNAQILYLEPILGTALYEKMLSLIDTNEITGTTYTNYNTLYNYIVPSLVFHTMELLIPLNSFKIEDGGTFQFTPSNATFSQIDEIDKISNKYRIIGNKYDKKLSDYLCQNSTLFSEYIDNTGIVKKTENQGVRCGWYLGGTSYSKIRI